MTKHINPLLFFILTVGFCYGQTTPNNLFVRKIGEVVKDSSSVFYYNKLLKKIKTNPGSIRKEDLYYLYYGQLFQKKPKGLPFLTNPEIGNFQRLIFTNRFKKAIPVGYEILEENPVELTTLLHLNGCLKKTKQEDTFNIDSRIKLLVDAILSTGDGKTPETAIKIADIQDDIILKDIMNFSGAAEFLESKSDLGLSIWRKDGNALYFEDLWAY